MSTKEVWRNIWSGIKTSYNQDKIVSQWDMFEKMKLKYLEVLFSKSFTGKQKVRSLECGCGGASVSVYCATKGYETVAFDYVLDAVDLARRNYEKVGASGTFLCADVENIPFKNNSFDIVMSFGLIEHFRDVVPQIREMVRVLNPGGMLFLDISPNGYHMMKRSIQCENLVKIFNFVVSFVFYCRKYRLSVRKAYRKARQVFVPEYHENQLSLNDYEQIVKSFGIGTIRACGNRPFPRIYFPGVLNTLYIKLMKSFEHLWIRFDNSNSKFTRIWGAGWWLHGIKE